MTEHADKERIMDNNGNYNNNNGNYNNYNGDFNNNGNNMKRLYRSRNNRMLCGVCAGIANYFSCDPTIIRLLMVFFGFCSFGTGLLAYIVMAIIVPETPYNE